MDRRIRSKMTHFVMLRKARKPSDRTGQLCYVILFCGSCIINRLVWLFAMNRTTIPRIYFCSELVCAIVDLDTVDLLVTCAHLGHNLLISFCYNSSFSFSFSFSLKNENCSYIINLLPVRLE